MTHNGTVFMGKKRASFGIMGWALAVFISSLFPATASDAELRDEISIVAASTGQESGQEKQQKIVVAGHGLGSIYNDVFTQIMKKTGLTVTFVSQDYQSLRKSFLDKEIDIVCCASPNWRTKPQEIEVQLFSNAFFYVVENYAYRPARFPKKFDPKDTTLIFASVKGWSYSNILSINKQIIADSVIDALELVHSGKADFTIVNKQEFMGQQHKKKRNLILGERLKQSPLHIRVHKDRADLVPIINQAITEMRKNLEISKIIAASVRGKSNAR